MVTLDKKYTGTPPPTTQKTDAQVKQGFPHHYSGVVLREAILSKKGKTTDAFRISFFSQALDNLFCISSRTASVNSA